MADATDLKSVLAKSEVWVRIPSSAPMTMLSELPLKENRPGVLIAPPLRRMFSFGGSARVFRRYREQD